jgi:hypothetical protein
MYFNTTYLKMECESSIFVCIIKLYNNYILLHQKTFYMTTIIFFVLLQF